MHPYLPAVSLSSVIVPGHLRVEAETTRAPIPTCSIAQQCQFLATSVLKLRLPVHSYLPAVSLSSVIVPGHLVVEAEATRAPIPTCSIPQQCHSSCPLGC